MKLKLPISLKEIEVKPITPAGIIAMRNELVDRNFWKAIQNALIGGISDIDGEPTIQKINKLYWKDAEFAIVRIFALSNISTMLTISSRHDTCGHINEFIVNRDGDNRFDALDIPIDYANEDAELTYTLKPFTLDEAKKKFKPLKFELENGEPTKDYFERLEIYTSPLRIFKRSAGHTVVNSITFRLPLLEDMINVNKKTVNEHDFDRALKEWLICGMEFETELDDISSYKDLMNRFRLDGLLDFQNYHGYYDDITKGISSYGLRPFFEVLCENCKMKYEQAYSFASFFVYGLQSN